MSVHERLTKRAQFLRAARGRKHHGRHVLVQSLKREEDPQALARFGFTVTKKTGNAVVRNRIRRRLRAAVLQTAPLHAKAGYDYVLIGRQSAVQAPFQRLIEDLLAAFSASGTKQPAKRARSGTESGAGA